MWFGDVSGEFELLARVAVLEERVRILTVEQGKCVTRQEWLPVRTIVYGLASAVGATVAAAVLKLGREIGRASCRERV